MQAVGLADQRSFAIPLTQELIGDALGLSVPHVNRVLRQLRDEELVTIKEGIVSVSDVDALSELADFEQGYLKPLSVCELFGAGPEAAPAIIERRSSSRIPAH